MKSAKKQMQAEEEKGAVTYCIMSDFNTETYGLVKISLGKRMINCCLNGDSSQCNNTASAFIEAPIGFLHSIVLEI